ncbi:hypothetical protein PROFUN_00951 [Planoprotostelium fungivorum]|uniref:START domain-containing protein n=1 Tax=Planoprotostelium fungivorum TaxID=1890364 RepID=A0A2P6N4A0_9EUKA|nr:hypothetical protein PROFUN_00951 [Planoprotostelium fungivorum]
MSWGTWFSSEAAPAIPALFPELPTPTSIRECEEISSNTLAQLILYAEQSDPKFKRPSHITSHGREASNEDADHPWVQINSVGDINEVSEDWDVLTFDRAEEGGITCVKSVAIMPCSVQRLASILSTTDTKERQKWDTDLLDMSVLKEVHSSLRVEYRNYRAALSVVAPRDFVILNGQYTSERLTVIYGTSINFPENPVSSRSVRGIVVSGFLIEAIDDSPLTCRCSRFVRVDPKGSIPLWVVSAGKKSAGKILLELRAVVRGENRCRPESQPTRSVVAHSKRTSEISDVQPPVEVENLPPIRHHHSDTMTIEPSLQHHHGNGVQSSVFPLPRTTSEEFHRQQLQHRESRQQREQELMDKLQRRQIVSQRAQQPAHMTEGQVEKLVRSLSALQTQLQESTETIRDISSSLDTERKERERLTLLLQQAVEENKKMRSHRSEPNLFGWEAVLFAVVWPFATYALADFISGRQSRGRR